jgi:uncharacterized protein YfiM (DUF2279 family)
MKNVIRFMAAAVVASSFAACGGGGGGGGGGGAASVIYYPYETVFGDSCNGQEPSPGCTFLEKDGSRVTVNKDPNYNKFGYGSDDLWYVKFDSSGNGYVYDDLGNFQGVKNIGEFAGHIGGTTIGVGTSGLFWENVTNGTYWWGKNGVLYSANSTDSNYGQAINDKTSSAASDTNFAALSSDANKKLVKSASARLVKEYGFQADKATAVASALNSWAVAAAERGATSDKDMDKTFKAVFGVQFSDALSAVKDLQFGSTDGMKELTNRSAAALGLKPHQAQKFMKGMYKKALANWGYDENSMNW